MIDVVDCSYADVMRDPAYFAGKWLHDGVFGLRGLHATEEEQVDIIVALGDYIGWVPRTSDFDRSLLRRYEEDHSHTFDYGDHTDVDLSVNWHLEHVHSTVENATVAGFWNMLKFDCPTDVGMTYFRDNSKLIGDLPESVTAFLRKCVIANSALVDRRGNACARNPRKALECHPFKDVEVIRISQTDVELLSVDGGAPLHSDIEQFRECIDTVVSEIVYNDLNRLTWNWQVGDLLVSDLFTMSHAVAGGFRKDERKFLGYFCSHPAIDSTYLIH
jgi:alpha-ketoglutarate-dependent taurine dioxygenase